MRVDKFTGSDFDIDKPELTDLVIAFDTTGSMRSYINDVKTHVRNLIPKMFKENPNLKISLVAFGDYCDMVSPAKYGNAYQVIDLTDNQQDLIAFVNNAKDTAGCDPDEFYELVIRKINEETPWRNGSNRSVLLIGDANPHPVGYYHENKMLRSDIDWRLEAKKAASLKIIYDTLSIRGAKWYQELSDLTNGLNLPFSNSSRTADLIETVSLARGGSATIDAFTTISMSPELLADKELKVVYTAYSKSIKKD